MSENKQIVKNVVDNRAMSDMGAALFVKRGGDTKYHLWMTLTNIPATGATNETIDTTVTTARMNTSVAGRQNPGQKECTFMAHRDNFVKLRNDNRKTLDFLQVNPDGTGYKFQGEVTFYQDEVTVGGNLTGKAIITVSKAEELPVLNVMDIIQDTVSFESAIPAVVYISGTGKEEINIETDPADATLTAESDTAGVATATISEKVLTITGVKTGSAIVKVKATSTECAPEETYILVVVE